MTDLTKQTTCKFTYWNDKYVVEKCAKSGVQRQLLENELYALEILSGLNAPKLVHVDVSKQALTVWRDFVRGIPLSQVPAPLWPALLANLTKILRQVHAKGLIHGDLKPSNLIVDGTNITPIDWEHALLLGEKLNTQNFRAVSLGTSHPRLIWGRGTVTENLDHYSIQQMSAHYETSKA